MKSKNIISTICFCIPREQEQLTVIYCFWEHSVLLQYIDVLSIECDCLLHSADDAGITTSRFATQDSSGKRPAR